MALIERVDRPFLFINTLLLLTVSFIPFPTKLVAQFLQKPGERSATYAYAATLLNSPNSAFINLGGPNPGSFDLGLPFFFGRQVFVGIEGQSTPGGVGPLWAY